MKRTFTAIVCTLLLVAVLAGPHGFHARRLRQHQPV